MNAAPRHLSSSVSWLVTWPGRDGLLAAALFAAFELPVLSNGVTASRGPLAASWKWTAAAALAGAAMTLPLAVRRQQPRRTWMIASGCALFLLVTPTQLGLLFTTGPVQTALLVLPAPVIALYTVVRAGRMRGGYALAGSVAALMLAPLGLLNLQWLLDGPSADVQRAHGRPYAAIAAVAVVMAWALADLMRARSRIEAVERAEHDRAVAAEERARIAAELHDITAHHISVVSLQAGAARLLAEQGQPPGIELLAGIEAASRQAMTEIREALGVIRAGPDGPAPLPGLAQLPDLATRMALAGLTVTVDGPADPLPGSMDLTAYRIVQEGLANVARHSAADRATVTFRREADSIHVTIADDGPARYCPPAGPGGNGLIGLRERVRRHGGRLHADPRPSGGFELRAELPLSGRA
jgi:signal transduction histidine kinase